MKCKLQLEEFVSYVVKRCDEIYDSEITGNAWILDVGMTKDSYTNLYTVSQLRDNNHYSNLSRFQAIEMLRNLLDQYESYHQNGKQLLIGNNNKECKYSSNFCNGCSINKES